MKLIFLLCLFIIVGVANAAWGATIRYVSPSGSGSACTTGSPCTVATALAATAAGDTVRFKTGGTYTSALDLSSVANGTSYLNAVTFDTESGAGTVIIQPSSGGTVLLIGNSRQFFILRDLIIDGRNIDVDGQSNINIKDGANHIQLINIETRNNTLNNPSVLPGAGALIEGGDYIEWIGGSSHNNGSGSNSYLWTGNVAPYGFYWHGVLGVLRNAQIYNNGCLGVQLYSSSYPTFNTDDMEVSGNTIYNNGVKCYTDVGGPGTGKQIVAWSGNRHRIFNNLLYSTLTTSTEGISAAGGSNSEYFNNTIYGMTSFAVAAQTTNSTWKNNILSNNTLGFEYIGSGVTFSNNLCSAAGTGCSIIEAPGITFYSAAGGDFNLALNSQAINNGVDVGLAFNGSAPDIGRYETATVQGAVTQSTADIDVQVGTAYAPFTAISNCTGWGLLVNAISQTLSGCSTPGNGVFRIHCSAPCMAAGNTITVSHGTSGIIDSQGQKLLPWNNFAVTNTLSGGGPVWTTKHYRCRVWNRPTTGSNAPDWYTPEDTACSVQNTNGKMAVVVAIDCTGGNCPATGFKWEWEINSSGTWTDVDNTCVSVANILCYDNTQVGGAVHGASIASSLLTNPQSIYVTGWVQAQNSSFNIVDLSQDSATNLMGSFALKNGLTAGSNLICVRPKQDSGAAISHNVTACFNVVNPGAQTP